MCNIAKPSAGSSALCCLVKVHSGTNQGAASLCFCAHACMFVSPRSVCVCVCVCVDGRGLSKALSFKLNASLRGACELRHYITRGVVSRPNLLQWTIPLPEFMFCSEEEAGETKQTCGGVYKFLRGDLLQNIVYKGFSKAMADCSRCWIFGWVNIFVGKNCDTQSLCEDESRIPNIHEGQNHRQTCQLLCKRVFPCSLKHSNVPTFTNNVL